MDYFPLFSRLTGASCLVVGGGPVGWRKTRQLLRAEAKVCVIAPDVIEELQTLANEGRISLRQESFDASMAEGHMLIVAATNNRRQNEIIAAAAQQANCFCNVVDDKELSTAILPGVVDRSPLLVAISTSGESPVLATRIRQLIETQLPDNLASLVQFSGEWRERVKTAFSDPDQRRRFWQDTLAGPIADQVLNGDTEAASKAMDASLTGQQPMHGEGWIVGAGPGDPELLTLKAARLLGAADVVLHDRLITPGILELARKDAEFIAVGKQGHSPSITQDEINALLVSLVRQGKRVCRLKGGDPFIFGRGGEELQALEEAGLRWQAVPGITAASGCAASAGIPLTHRDVARSVVFITAHTHDDFEPDWQSLGNSGQTVVFYMALSRVQNICNKLLAAGHKPDLAAMVIGNGTTSREQLIRGTLSNLGKKLEESDLESPALLIIGAVTELRVKHLLTKSVTAPDDWLPAAGTNRLK